MSLDTAKVTVIRNDLTAAFDNAVKAATPFYPKLCTPVDSNRDSENYGWLGSMPGVKEWLGDRNFQELRAATYALANKHWESSVTIPKNNVADDTWRFYRAVLSDLGIEAMHHPDELLFDLIVAGETTACFDGQFFFDTDHVWGDSGSQSNDISTTVVLETAVTTAEFKTMYHAARQKMLGYKNDQGKLLNRPTIGKLNNLLLLVPLELEQQAHEAVESTLLGGGDSNIIIDKPQIVASAYLTSGLKFYLFNLDMGLKPFVFQKRLPLKRQMTGNETIEFKDLKFMTEARYNVGYLAWWKAVLTTFATA
jgi:phage major head subunit gpT-like protein